MITEEYHYIDRLTAWFGRHHDMVSLELLHSRMYCSGDSMNRINDVLDGKITVTTLEVFHPNNTGDPMGPKRLLLDKGELAQIYSSDEPVRSIAYIELIQNTTRGSHYHLTRGEHLYMIRGTADLIGKDIQTNETATIRVREGDLIYMAPMIAHKINVIKSGHAIEFSYKTYDATETVSYSLGT
jgi:hypothetical protein